ncbi:cation channel sperm-associated auxiliary subunit zeta [Cynocephalus volans]|uniref:cation channel sperm-associated auxiliary subunit zeta n=1 Tax=Cynocephalus volans TaxID=110931 RepID=UPI002FC6EFC3
MEEKPVQVSPELPDRRGSDRASPHSNDIRNLWTTVTLSQSHLNLPLSGVCEDFDGEGGVGKTRRWSDQKDLWEDDGEDFNLSPGDLDERNFLERELHRGGSLENLLEGDDDSKSESEKSSSMSSLNIPKYTPHRAYWAEQQNRLPLPLMELMENEALEILTKALRSYQSEIGGEHFMTKELQRYIEALRRRRIKRLNVKVH